MKTVKKILLFICLPLVLTSCGAFGEGLLMGLSNMGSMGGNGLGYSSTPVGGGVTTYPMPPLPTVDISSMNLPPFPTETKVDLSTLPQPRVVLTLVLRLFPHQVVMEVQFRLQLQQKKSKHLVTCVMV